MDTEDTLTLKQIISFLKIYQPDKEPLFYKDWTKIEESDTEFWRKDEFRCELRWQKVKLYDIEAQEYLSSSQHDLIEDSKTGMRNALSNTDMAKKCRVDEILKLVNLAPISSRKRWNLSKKMSALEVFGVPNLNILNKLLTSKRNKSTHEYVNPEREEVRDAIELAELFLQATNQYIEKGYISSVLIAYDSWFKPPLVAATWFGGNLGEIVNKKYGYEEGYSNEYQIAFDLEHETITLSYLDKEIYRRCNLKTGKENMRRESIIKKEGPLTIPCYECKVDEVVELMTLLRASSTNEV